MAKMIKFLLHLTTMFKNLATLSDSCYLVHNFLGKLGGGPFLWSRPAWSIILGPPQLAGQLVDDLVVSRLETWGRLDYTCLIVQQTCPEILHVESGRD